MQVLGLASVVAVLAVAGVSAASTLRNRGTSEATSEGTVVPETRPAKTAKADSKAPAPRAEPVVQQSAPAKTQPETTTTPVATPPAPVNVPAPAAGAPLKRGGFVVVEGRTQIADSVVAIRTGDSVVVNFDAYGFRTRRSDKIENTFRLTLPMIFGRMATAALDTVPDGAFVTNRDVIGSLASEGMRFTLANGAVVRLRILTRPVTDGPIAIGYLATFER